MQFVPLDLDINIDKYSYLLSHVFSNHNKFQSEYLKWLYLENPAGNAFGMDAFDKTQLVAHYATTPFRIKVGEQHLQALLSLNTATHLSYRGQGLFIKLAEETYRRAAESGYDCVIGVANSQSTPGFLKKLGFSLIRPLDVLFFPIRPRIRGNNDNNSMQQIWTCDQLKWRLQVPGSQYCYSETMESCLVYTKPKKFSPNIILGYFPSSSDLSTIVRDSCKKEKNTIHSAFWIGLDNVLSKKWHSISVPDFIKPSPLNLIFKPLKSGFRIPNYKEVRFSTLDFDAY